MFVSKQRNYLVDVDYDCLMEHVFYSDVIDGYIGRINTDSPGLKILYRNLEFPEGIAVDWVHRKIYWTESKGRRISVGKLDGSQSTVLFREMVYQPRDILCDPIRGKIYWTDWNPFYPKIEMANLDGSGRTVLLGSRYVGKPNMLTMDYDRNRLCWTDHKFSHVACMKLDGRRAVELITKSVGHPFGITNGDNIFYWTDWKSDMIQRQHILTTERLPSIKPGFKNDGKLYGIRFVNNCNGRKRNFP